MALSFFVRKGGESLLFFYEKFFHRGGLMAFYNKSESKERR